MNVKVPLTVSLLERLRPLELFTVTMLNVVTPVRVCWLDPLNVTVLLLAVKAPLFVKFPLRVSLVEPMRCSPHPFGEEKLKATESTKPKP